MLFARKPLFDISRCDINNIKMVERPSDTLALSCSRRQFLGEAVAELHSPFKFSPAASIGMLPCAATARIYFDPKS
jgi:hypothetical protein